MTAAVSNDGKGKARVDIGWGGLTVASHDERFRLDLHFLLRIAGSIVVDSTSAPALPAGTDDPVLGLVGAANARPLLIFHAWEDRLVLLAQAEFGGTPRLLDARVDVKLTDEVTIAGGLMVVPFSRAWNVPLPVIQTMDRSVVNGLFAPPRRIGGTMHATPADGVVEIWAGAFEPTVSRLQVQAPLGVVRLRVNPLGRFAPNEVPSELGPAPTRVGIGAGVVAEPIADPVDPTAPDAIQVTGTADYAVQTHGFTAYGEAFLRATTLNDHLGWGASGQLGQFILPQHLQILGRIAAYDTDVEDTFGVTLMPEAHLVGYVRDTHLMVDARYRVTIDDNEAHDHAVTMTGQIRI